MVKHSSKNFIKQFKQKYLAWVHSCKDAPPFLIYVIFFELQRDFIATSFKLKLKMSCHIISIVFLLDLLQVKLACKQYNRLNAYRLT